MFSTEELGLATGASAPVARKKICFFVCFIEGIEKGMYSVVIIFQQKFVPRPTPLQRKFSNFSEKSQFLTPPLHAERILFFISEIQISEFP